MKIFITLSIICSSLFLIGCNSKKTTIKISGSTTVLPVISKAAEAYRILNPDVHILINSGGSGVGFSQFSKGIVDIGMMSRDISDHEKTSNKGINYEINTIGRDAVAVALSSEIFDSGVTTLNLKQIRKIYMGEIKNWKILGGPDRKIFVIDKEKSRGTRHVFMKNVFGNEHQNTPGTSLVTGSNNEELSALTQSNAAIGMISHSWLNNEVKGANLNIKGKIIEPTLKTILSDNYPLSRNLNLISKKSAKPEVKKFLDFILSAQGQKFVTKSGYVSNI
ncbi:MAG: phosphate-binding protein [Candidatus Cloacimonadota bacterium]|nr:MAG: phosphate-binding protein [Candidatus Cloacimonadota bacterium]